MDRGQTLTLDDQSVGVTFSPDDTNLFAAIGPNFESQDRAKLQKVIDRITERCKRWHMTLNTAKCRIMNIRRLNQGEDCRIIDHAGERDRLTATTKERDIGIEKSKFLKSHDQVCKAVSTAYMVLGMLSNTFISRDP